MKHQLKLIIAAGTLALLTACDEPSLIGTAPSPVLPITDDQTSPTLPVETPVIIPPVVRQALYRPNVNEYFNAQTGNDLWPGTHFVDRFEADGRLAQRFYRLTPKPNDQTYPIQFQYIDVTRHYSWQINDTGVSPVETCWDEVRQNDGQTLTIEVCQLELSPGSPLSVTIEDSIYIVSDADGAAIFEPLNQYYDAPPIEMTLPTERAIRLSQKETIKSCVDSVTNRACDSDGDTPIDEKAYYPLLPDSVQTLLSETHIHSSKRQYWQSTYPHNDVSLTEVAKAMEIVAEQGKIQHQSVELLLNYVRAHNYFTYGNDQYAPTETAAAALHEGLTAIANMDGFFSVTEAAAIAQEGYAVAIQGQNFNDFFRESYMKAHYETALNMIKFQAEKGSVIAGDWHWGNAVFQTLGVVDYTSDQSRSPVVYNFFTENRQTLLNHLIALGYSDAALWKGTNGEPDAFVFENIIDAMTRIYRLEKHGNSQTAAELLRPQIDSSLLTLLNYHSLELDNTDIDERFINSISLSLATYYATWTDRDAVDFCANDADFGAYCQPLDETTLFDPIYECSDTLRLKARTSSMTQDQKQTVCQTLSDQEAAFHAQLQTNQTPVVDDYNTQLEIVIFSSSEDWKTYGGPLYNVSTDNGGIYIEGNPSTPGNQARFFAYIAEWLPEFAIWNLEHEYVHYLDGRYNLYGPFMHYPENRTTWWSEGIAEYIAHGECFGRGLDLVADETTPSLESILFLTYNSGANMVYSWSYTVHRYLNDMGLETTWLDMARALRQSDKQTALSQYQALLDNLITYHSVGFQQWVDDTLRPNWLNNRQCVAHSHEIGRIH